MSTPILDFGRSLMCPTEAFTVKPLPRYFLIVLALAGDSTMTRLAPRLDLLVLSPGSPASSSSPSSSSSAWRDFSLAACALALALVGWSAGLVFSLARAWTRALAFGLDRVFARAFVTASFFSFLVAAMVPSGFVNLHHPETTRR